MTNLNDLMAGERTRRGLDNTPAPVAAPINGSLALVRTDDPRAREWLTKALDGTSRGLAQMGQDTGRNDALNAAAYKLGRFVPRWLSETDVRNTLLEACRSNGLLAEDGLKACEDSLNSGLSAGMDEPRDPPLRADDGAQGLTGLVAGPVGIASPRTAYDAPLVDSETGEILTDEQIAQRAHEARTHTELLVLRARHDAKTQHSAEIAARTFRAPAYTRTLTEELLIPEQPVTYAVEQLLPTGGNALLAAGFKTGKTTLVTNLLRAYADDEPFLGRFQVSAGTGRIGIFNYELSPDQYRRWLRSAGITNTERVAVLHLRGHRLPLTSPSVEDWIVAWLKEQDVTFWIADPFARAATGTDENSNTEVGVWLDTFDVIKERAGVSEAVLPTHTGRAEQEHGQERARGATRLDDWADVRWLLVKDDEDRRYFRATGRDVEMAEEQLVYDPLTRALTMSGGDRNWVRSRELEQRVLDFINAHPGCSVRAVESGVQGKKEAITGARSGLLARHKIRLEDGPNNSQMHFANEVEA
jgi:hypothetical protein